MAEEGVVLCGGATEKMVLEMEGRDAWQDLIPNVSKSEFTNVPIKGWIIDPDVYGLFGGPSDVVCLLAHYGEIVHTNVMPRGVTMIIGGGRGPEMFFQPYPKSP